MAGFDHIDPANPCLGCGTALAHVWKKLQILTERLYDFFEKCQRASWVLRTTVAGEHGRGSDPEWQARCVC
jgi:hypothetical protein